MSSPIATDRADLVAQMRAKVDSAKDEHRALTWGVEAMRNEFSRDSLVSAIFDHDLAKRGLPRDNASRFTLWSNDRLELEGFRSGNSTCLFLKYKYGDVHAPPSEFVHVSVETMRAGVIAAAQRILST